MGGLETGQRGLKVNMAVGVGVGGVISEEHQAIKNLCGSVLIHSIPHVSLCCQVSSLFREENRTKIRTIT